MADPQPTPRHAPPGISGDALPILEASPNAVLGVSPAGSIVYVNPRVEETFGWEPGELLGRPVEILVPAALAGHHKAHRDSFVGHPTARPMGIGLDLAARRKDGTEFPVEISLVPLETSSGLLVLATIVDITARRALESQLFEARKMESIGRLSGGIAHDFNNILTAIIGFAELALAKPDEDATFELTTIKEAAQRAAGLTQQLLAFGRKQILRPQLVDPNSVIANTEPMLRRLIGENIEVVVSTTTDVGTIKVDPTQLGQVILNLAINGRDAMPEGGRLVIRSERAHFDDTDLSRHFEIGPGNYVVLSVADTGIGMDAETRAHIFEPFFTTKEVGKGTGLGLATTYGIVKQSGGYIWVYSEVGHGTTFRIYFPAMAEMDRETPGAEPPARGYFPRHRILLVEDEPMLRELARRVLAGANFDVVTAASATEALGLVRNRPPSEASIELLVSDVVMPGMSGSELAVQMRDLIPGLRVLLMSGYTEAVITAGMIEGQAFVAKPFTPQTLLAAVDNTLSEPLLERRPN
jgi:two-component system, cell cycle sensor histidine kinase and response regulator CckA